MPHPLKPRAYHRTSLSDERRPAVASTGLYEIARRAGSYHVPADDYRVLGTDGRSDSRENLRHHFEADASAVVAALGELQRGEIDKSGLLTQSPNSTSMQIKLTRVWRKR